MIGVVTGVQGMRWYEVTVLGQDAHTGFDADVPRKNALLGAARVINAVDAIAHAFAPDAVATVGLIETQAQQPQRDPRRGVLHRRFAPSRRSGARADGVADACCAAGNPRPVDGPMTQKCIWTSPAVQFAPELIRCVRHAAEKAGY